MKLYQVDAFTDEPVKGDLPRVVEPGAGMAVATSRSAFAADLLV
jgi:hypothetical protein